MITYDWYKIFSLTDFLNEEITSREMIVLLESIGRTTVLISRGNLVSITYNGVFLPVNFLENNPYIDSGLASYVDDDNNVWLGIEVAA
jgi:hypothetical protein